MNHERRPGAIRAAFHLCSLDHLCPLEFKLFRVATRYPWRVPGTRNLRGRVKGSFLPSLLLLMLCCGSPVGAQVSSASNLGSTQPPAVSEAGTVSGSVNDATGALLQGAKVQLRTPDAGSFRTLTSDRDGRFLFLDVPPGSFDLLITLPGFVPVTLTGSLEPAQHLALSVPALHLATFTDSVDAIASPDELATEQVVTEEHQRLLGVLPNFFVSYNWNALPLTTRQKFTLATRNALDPGNLFLVGTVAGVQQATNAFPGYHQGAAGYGKRYGADLANLVAGTYMGGAVLPTLFHQDPRYFYKGTGSRRSRFLYALSTAVICRGDSGHRQPAFASVLGDFSAGAISNLYYAASDRQGAVLTVENGLLGVAGDAMNNVFQEFVLKKLTSKK